MLSSLFIVIALAGMLPAILMAPHAGILIWSWISYMNPHRLSYGFIQDIPMLDAVAAFTSIAWLTSRERKLPPLHAVSVMLIVYFLWTCFTTLFAHHDATASDKLLTFTKIILFTFFTLIFITNKQRLRYMIYVILLGLSLFSVKGGIFTILNGGQYIVFGPAESFLNDNNQLALAFLTVVPLFYWAFKYGETKLIRYAAGAGGLLTLISVIGSHSRGALVALAAMATWMIIIGRRWTLGVFLSVGVIGGAVVFMPDDWVERMGTISDYEADQSSSTRLNMWKYATNVANASPVIGGGFNFFFDRTLANQHMPGGGKIYVAHSIYFDTLGEHGYVGLFFYLLLFSAAFVTTFEIRKLTKGKTELAWANDLGQMLQFCLVGFGTGGAFLSLSIFDLYYHIIALTLMTHFAVLKSLGLDKKMAIGFQDFGYGGKNKSASDGVPAQ